MCIIEKNGRGRHVNIYQPNMQNLQIADTEKSLRATYICPLIICYRNLLTFNISYLAVLKRISFHLSLKSKLMFLI